MINAAVKPDWPAIQLKKRSKRLQFTPDPKLRLYLVDLLNSGLWGRNPADVLNNLLREGIIAVKARGVTFPCERPVVENSTRLLKKQVRRHA